MKSEATRSQWISGLLAALLSTNLFNPDAAADDPLRRVIDGAIQLARQHKDVPPAAEPPPGALNILRAYYGDETTPWLLKASTVDLIDALPWTLRIPVSRERLIEIAGLGVQPGTRAFARLPDVQLAEALLVQLTGERSLSLEEFHAVARRVVATWAAGEPPHFFEFAGDYLCNATFDERAQVRFPNAYTASSYYRRRAPDEPPLAVAALGPRAVDLVPDLALAAANGERQFDSLTLLALVSSQNAVAVEALVDLVRGPDSSDAQTALEVYAGSDAIDHVQELLADANEEVRERAASLLLKLGGPNERGAVLLIKGLGDANHSVAWEFLLTLAAKPPAPGLIAEHLEPLLRARSIDVTGSRNGRSLTPTLLVAELLGPAEPLLIRKLKDELRDGDPVAKWGAVERLRSALGDELAAVVLAEGVLNGDRYTRLVSANSLARMGSRAKLTAPILSASLPGEDLEEAEHICAALRAE